MNMSQWVSQREIIYQRSVKKVDEDLQKIHNHANNLFHAGYLTDAVDIAMKGLQWYLPDISQLHPLLMGRQYMLTVTISDIIIQMSDVEYKKTGLSSICMDRLTLVYKIFRYDRYLLGHYKKDIMPQHIPCGNTMMELNSMILYYGEMEENSDVSKDLMNFMLVTWSKCIKTLMDLSAMSPDKTRNIIQLVVNITYQLLLLSRKSHLTDGLLYNWAEQDVDLSLARIFSLYDQVLSELPRDYQPSADLWTVVADQGVENLLSDLCKAYIPSHDGGVRPWWLDHPSHQCHIVHDEPPQPEPYILYNPPSLEEMARNKYMQIPTDIAPTINTRMEPLFNQLNDPPNSKVCVNYTPIYDCKLNKPQATMVHGRD